VALFVSDIFKSPRVALPVYLRDCTIKLALLRSAQHNALDVTVDEVIIIILLKDLGSRITKDLIPLLVGKCAWKRRELVIYVKLVFLKLLRGLTISFVCRLTSERVICDKNLVPYILSRLF
jgi:hypothetical protein